MRQWRRKKYIAMATLLLLFSVYIGVSLLSFSYYTHTKFWNPAPKCFNYKEHNDRLIRLTCETHEILQSMGIEHWLMFGSLWGPLRGIPGPLPWDHDVDIGIDGDGNVSKIPVEEFKARFEAAGLGITDKLQESGSFLVAGSVELFVFYNYRGTMMRRGYETWLFYIHYRIHSSFPSRFVKQPLARERFGSCDIPVPREGKEIMKHLYPFNWWKVVKPASCENRS